MLKTFVRFVFLSGLLALLSPQAQAQIVGSPCLPEQVGTTQLDSTHENIIACLKDSGSQKWKSSTGGGDSLPKGMVAYFALTTCPSGWQVANGSVGTIDVRGGFIRALDNAPGGPARRDPDSLTRVVGSWQGDAIRNIKGKVGPRVARAGDQTSGPFYETGEAMAHHTDPGGSTSKWFDASRVVPTAPENRPLNIVLLACQKM